MQSDAAVDVLLEGLTHAEESVRRSACYGLKISGPAHANKILPFVGNQRVSIRRLAVYALGESANGLNVQVVRALLSALTKDKTIWLDRTQLMPWVKFSAAKMLTSAR